MTSTYWFGLCFACCISVIVEGSIIYSAQCQSKCLGYKVAKNSQGLKQCLKPCNEKKLGELFSCHSYCNGSAPCHYSCKFIKSLSRKGILPGQCSPVKQPNEQVCHNNDDCDGLTKCCYKYCKEISVKGEVCQASVTNITRSSLVLQWQKSNITNAVYIIQVRVLHSTTIYYEEDEWGRWQQIKWQGSDVVPIRFVSIRSGTRLQFRVAVVNSTGLQSIGPPTRVIRTLFHASRPSHPEDVWLSKTYKENKVDVSLSWSPPSILDTPVHIYRLFWKEISPNISSIKRFPVPGMQLNYTITGLQIDKIYHIEIQAVCRWKRERLKSPKLAMNVSTQYPKGTADTDVVTLTNISNFSHRGFNNSSSNKDEEFDEVEVIVESSDGTTKPRTREPSDSSSDRSSGGGRSAPVAILIFMLIYLTNWY